MSSKSNYLQFLQSSFLVNLLVLGAFSLLSLLITYPLFLNLSDFSIYHLYSDALLEAWTLKWDIHTLLSGLSGIQNFWNANIFYPYPNTLAFSEHLLSTAFLLAPVTFWSDTPLVAANLGILLTTTLSGWGAYLLVTWLTGNRGAGIIAGIVFATAPFRLSHLTQLHLLSTHWIPFIFLVMARLIKFNRSVDLILLIIFTNLQFFASINYAPLVALGVGIWTLAYLYLYRNRLSLSLTGRLLIFAIITLLFNWPILRRYQEVSEHLGVVRTLGDAKIYGAALINYLLPIGNSLLYGRWLGLPTHLDYLSSTATGALISTFSGIIPLLLAITSLSLLFSRATRKYLRFVAVVLLIISFTGFILSFGTNDEALGKNFSAITAHLLPYSYLYTALPLLQGLRVPIRFALLPTFGVAILAGLGFTTLSSILRLNRKQVTMSVVILGGLIVLEHFPAPLPGVTVPYGSETYHWLAKDAPPSSVVLELPYYLHTPQSHQELLREYQSAIHWQHLVNGASGFKPEGLVQLGLVLDTFPDWQSFDLLQQLGVDYLVLHRNEYSPEAWANITALLPLYLPAIEQLYTPGEDLILKLSDPDCFNRPAQVYANATRFPVIAFSNESSSTWIGDPQRLSVVENGLQEKFLEPLFVLPGQTQEKIAPLAVELGVSHWQVSLGNLAQSLNPQKPATDPQGVSPSPDKWQPVEVPFANGAVLQAMAMSESPQACGKFDLALQWRFTSNAGESVRVELVDRFDRPAVSSKIQVAGEDAPNLTVHRLPLAQTIPAGLYQLRVRLFDNTGADLPALGPEGTPLGQPLSLPLIIRPPEVSFPASEPTYFASNINLLGIQGPSPQAEPGDWLRFTLYWQSQSIPDIDYTVFTQLLGPDGQVWGQHDNPPKGGAYPTSIWQVEETVSDDYAIRVDPAAPLGEYQLIVGMYNSATGERVPVTKGSGMGQDFSEGPSILLVRP